MQIRKLLALGAASVLCLSLAACSSPSAQQSAQTASAEKPSASTSTEEESPDGSAAEPQTDEAAPTTQEGQDADRSANSADASSGARILVAYFSYPENADLPADVDVSASASVQDWNGALTGNAAVLANMIAADSGGELYSILTEQKYPDTYDATIELARSEQDENARPALASQLPDFSQYDTIFLGYPNWWGDLPMPVCTFLDEADLSGKTIIPFVTHGGSGFSGTIRSIQDAEPDATVIEDGLSVGAGSVADAQQQVDEWVASLGLPQG